jgi:two-component system nitrogen regulation response regulator GlnG
LRNIVIRLTAKHPGQVVSRRLLEDELDLQDETPALATSVTPTPANQESPALIAQASQRLQQPEPFSLDRLLAETERSYIEAALRLAHDNVSQAARLLGINRTTLYNRMESFAREP